MASHHHGIHTLVAAFVASAIVVASPVYGGVQDFIDKEEWIKAVGEFTTVDFTGFDVGTFITDQYADLGILFTDGNDSIQHTASYVNDGAGLDGNGNIRVTFDTPQLWIGVDFPGYLDIELYYQGKLLHTGIFGFGGHGNFGGILSDQPFDAAVLIDPAGEAEIDDVHFGPPRSDTCPWDLDDNGVVGASDLLSLLVQWGADPDGPPDFDGDGIVGAADLLALLVNWGRCP